MDNNYFQVPTPSPPGPPPGPGVPAPPPPSDMPPQNDQDGPAPLQSKPSGIMKKKKKKPSAKATRRKEKKKKREKMKEDDVVQSEIATWKVIKLLGSGGFGDVYKVVKTGPGTNGDGPPCEKKESSPNHSPKKKASLPRTRTSDLNVRKKESKTKHHKEYAMKTEMVEGEVRMLRLKVEVTVLKQCWEQTDPEARKHFVEFVDRGLTEKFKFLVMGLVGPSLDDIRRSYLVKNFNKATAMTASMQTLTSIANLHSVGWIHRDIKPQNFAVGLGDKENVIYMLDFGIARKIFKPDTREMIPPREKVKFLGTLRFASRACHHGRDQGRKDDVETWIFMAYDLFDDERGLPWKYANDKEEYICLKEKFCKHDIAKPSKIVPKEFKTIIDYVCTLEYPDEVNYKFIETVLANAVKSNGIKMDKKLEWVGKLHKKVKVEESEEESSDNRQSGSYDGDSEERKEVVRKKQSKPMKSRNSQLGKRRKASSRRK